MPDSSNSSSKHGPSLKKSIFERQKEEAEAKRAKEQAETAAVLEDFVKSFEDEGGRPTPAPSRGLPTGPGRRHFTSSGLRSGPGSLGPAPGARSGPGSLGTPYNRRRPHEDFSDRREKAAFFSSQNDRKESFGDDQEADDKAAAKPTVHLSCLPPGTSPTTLKGLFLSSQLTVDNVRIFPASSQNGHVPDRKASSAIVTLAADTPAADIDTLVSRLQNKYLGFGFNLSISRGLSSAALSNANVSTGALHDLPFGAKPVVHQTSLSRAPPPGHRFAPPPSYTSSAPHSRHTTQVSVQTPSDLKQLKLIHKTVEALLTYGPEFEALLMSRPEVQRDEQWSWLYNSRSIGGVYYRWRLWEILTDAKSRTKHGRYTPQVLFDGQSVWSPPEESLRFEFTTRLEDFVSDDDYNSSDEEEDDAGIATRYNDHNASGAPIEETHDGLGYLDPMARSKLVHLLSRLPDSSAKLRRGDVARITAFAIEHAGAGAEEVAMLITRNVVRPLGGGADDDKTSASQVGLYAISDILSSSASAGVRHAWRYRTLFEASMRQQKVWEKLGRAEKDHSWGKLKAEKWKRSIQMLLNLWEGWSVFPQASHEEFTNAFLNPPMTDKERALAEAEEKRKTEDGSRKTKSVSRWRSVEDDQASTEVDMIDADGAAMHEDSDMDDAIGENIDGISMKDSSDEDADQMDIVNVATIETPSEPPGPPAKPSLVKIDPLTSGKRQRPRAVDLFADDAA